MSSEDAKPVKKEEDGDEKSLSSILESRKKKPTNANAKPKVVKNEVENADDDFNKPINRVASDAKEFRVKKEHNDILEDDKPVFKISSTTITNTAKADNKVYFLFNFLCLLFWLCFGFCEMPSFYRPVNLLSAKIGKKKI